MYAAEAVLALGISNIEKLRLSLHEILTENKRIKSLETGSSKSMEKKKKKKIMAKEETFWHLKLVKHSFKLIAWGRKDYIKHKTLKSILPMISLDKPKSIEP